MIYLLSDLHENIEFEAFNRYIAEEHSNDLLIILGDVCLKLQETKENERFTEYFLSAKCPIAILDGNHENFDYLYSFPVEDWNGGKIHRITPNIVHLMRGYVFELEGNSFLAFGGCRSSEGWKAQGRWFPQEEASEEEYALAYENIKNHNYKVDYILTHKYNPDANDTYCVPKLCELTRFIDSRVEFKQWYSGHCHEDRVIDSRHRTVYDCLVKIKL